MSDTYAASCPGRLSLVAFATAVTLACVPSPLLAQQQNAPGEQEATWVLSSGRSLTLFPSGEVYPLYVADPHRATNVIAEDFTIGGSIPATLSPLTRLGAGGRFGVLRVEPGRADGRSWQVSLEAGLDALFDSQNRLDVVGWDGNYGLTVTTASNSRVALKFAAQHVSAHVGDEYQERTERTRLNYTREELNVGAAFRWSSHWRAYGETGWAYRMGDPSLEPWRVQMGIQGETGPGRCGSHLACYVAADFSSMQERDWRVDKTVDVGIAVRGVGRTTRIFLEWHDGRPTVNEFFTESISSISVGLKIDL
jgi:Protein of unknown function (DUF1207)